MRQPARCELGCNRQPIPAKCFASDLDEVTTGAAQLFGGYGYTRDYLAERMMRDAKLTQLYEGTNQTQALVMACQVLKGNA